jgi:uncharacterized lipoprotein YddW (UPF0748 family)
VEVHREARFEHIAGVDLFEPARIGAEEFRGWWMTEPIRWIQTNLPETDAALNPRKFVSQIADYDGNVLLMTMGGISAYYPSRVQYHYVSPYIPKDHDTFGEVLAEAHARHIRIVGRFDFSKAHKEAFDAHPEWFFKKADGSPAPYNGLYQACINGGWYREKGVEMLTEALERYDVDGLFFNMFNNPAADYSGHPRACAIATTASACSARVSAAIFRISPIGIIKTSCATTAAACRKRSPS